MLEASLGVKGLSESLKSPLPCLLAHQTQRSERGAGPGETVPGRKAPSALRSSDFVRAGAEQLRPAAVPGEAAPDQRPTAWPTAARQRAEGDPVAEERQEGDPGAWGKASWASGEAAVARQRGTNLAKREILLPCLNC